MLLASRSDSVRDREQAVSTPICFIADGRIWATGIYTHIPDRYVAMVSVSTERQTGMLSIEAAAAGRVSSQNADVSEEARLSKRLSSLGKQSRWAGALMELMGVRLTQLTHTSSHNALAAACGKSQAWEVALGLIGDAWHRSLRLNAITFGAGALACQVTAAWRRCTQLLSNAREMSTQVNVVFCTALLHACGRASGEGKWAFAVLDLMRAEAMQLTEVSFGAAMSACAPEGQRQEALVLFKDSQQMGPNLHCCNAFLTSLEKGGRAEQAMELLKSMERAGEGSDWPWPRPDVVSYSAVISACEKSGLWVEAWDLLWRMRAKHVQPNAISFSAVISAFEKGGQGQLALHVLRMMQACSERPNVISYGAAISACEKAASWTQAQALLDEMVVVRLEPNLVCFNAMLSSLMEAGKAVMATRLLNSMRENSSQPDIISYSIAITSCSRMQQWLESVEILAGMAEQELDPTCIAYEATFAACEAHGKLEFLCLLDPMSEQAVRSCRSLGHRATHHAR